jgi:hypothetical protein
MLISVTNSIYMPVEQYQYFQKEDALDSLNIILEFEQMI